ncbi:MAG: hypothetical protein PHW86_00165 [Candidatus Bipolaricaulis sp.]|nr:hypothetical protein [Candidatus Bipolaricaulis sp.]
MNRLARYRINKSPESQGRALRLIVAEAARSVPHYRNLFASAGLAPDGADCIQALATLPVTSRAGLSEPPHTRFLNERTRENRLYASHTSGSTGTPATIFMSKPELNFRRLLLFRAVRTRFSGCLPRTVTDVGQMTAQKMPRLIQRYGPVRLTRVPGNAPISEQVIQYVRSAPQLLEGYAGCLELLAQELETRRHYPRPRWLISRGEILTPAARALLARVFECPVADFYNSEEIGNIAWDCPDRHGVLHVNTDSCIIELVDEQGIAVPPGVEGRVVVTNLYNRTMPFIRYDLGDHATWDRAEPHRCSCGANTPTLAAIDGRSDDFIFLPDSRRVSPLVVLTTVLNGCARKTPQGVPLAQVRQFQVVQEVAGEVEVRVVPHGSLPLDLDHRIQTEFRRLHPAFRVRVSAVTELPLERSGKLKRVVRRAGAESETMPPPARR